MLFWRASRASFLGLVSLFSPDVGQHEFLFKSPTLTIIHPPYPQFPCIIAELEAVNPIWLLQNEEYKCDLCGFITHSIPFEGKVFHSYAHY